MSEGRFYNKVELLEEVQRYKTSNEFLELLFQEFNGSKRLLTDGIGSRLLTVLSALTDALYGVDINQGSIDRAKELIASWGVYKNYEPLSTEFRFLESKGLPVKFNNCHFYLIKLPAHMTGRFDGELASELFLHLTEKEIESFLKGANNHLRPDGKFVFTAYVTGNENSLDEKFAELGAKIGMKKTEFVENGQIDIRKLARELKKQNRDLFEESKRSYWLDLERARVFPEENLEELCRRHDFKIKSKQNINCGMFPFAYRLVYVLSRR